MRGEGRGQEQGCVRHRKALRPASRAHLHPGRERISRAEDRKEGPHAPVRGACGLWIGWQRMCDTYANPLPRTSYTCGVPVQAPRGGPQHCTPGRQLSQSHTSGQGARTRASQLPVSALEAMSCNMTPTVRWGWPWRHGAEACLEPSRPAALRAGCTGPQNPQANYQIKSNPLSKHV